MDGRREFSSTENLVMGKFIDNGGQLEGRRNWGLTYPAASDEIVE